MADLLNDRYDLHEVVGSGGMGAVYRATDTRLGRTVAVKVLRGGPLADDHARSRMRSEANLAAAIHHPGVAQVFDYDEDRDSAGNTFIVMQFVEGHTLAQLLSQQGAMAAEQVMAVVVQVAEGLQAAHEAGVVHRDLKPANIMLTPNGRAVLVDFGIARSDTSDPLTDTGSLIGTADYMSPEQAAGGSATMHSDLYALGVIAHHCLTGVSPFRRESHIATALAHLRDDLPELPSSVPQEVADLIVSLTAKDPSDRPSTAAAVALQAAVLGADSTIDLPPTFEIPSPRSHPPAGVVTTGSEIAAATVERNPRPKAMYAGIGLLAIIIAFLGFGQMRTGADPTVPSVVGMNVKDATDRLQGEGLNIRTQTVDIAGEPEGRVVEQSPAGGKSEPDDGSVTLSVASGKVVLPAKSVIGLSYAKGAAVLERLGLEVQRKDVPQPTNAGQVVALDRTGRVADGSTITLSVAVAPAVRRSIPAGTSQSKGSGKSGSKGKAKGKKK